MSLFCILFEIPNAAFAYVFKLHVTSLCDQLASTSTGHGQCRR